MDATPALFPKPEVAPPALSAALGGPGWRLLRGQEARWTHIRPRTIDCEECAHLQHEQRGSYGPRRQAKHRRVVPGRVRLDLCHAHALAWRHRDENDSAGIQDIRDGLADLRAGRVVSASAVAADLRDQSPLPARTETGQQQ
jgi:hypothetical protein